MGNVKARVILVMIGAPETITKSLKQYLSNIPGKHEIKELKNTAILATTRTAEITNAIVLNIFHGRNNITCSTNCKYRTAATLHTLETTVCFRYVIVYTLHKDDNKDDDNDNNIFINYTASQGPVLNDCRDLMKNIAYFAIFHG
jgi:hypothetical protein